MDNVKIGDCQPCPFCGTPNDIELSRVDVQDREGFPVAMSCATCGCVGPWDYCPISDENYWLATAMHKWNQQSALNELSQLRAERDGLKARVETRDALINVMAPMHQLTCRNHKSCPICKAYDKYSKEIDGESVDTTPGGDE